MRMPQTAYFLAESDGFQRDPIEYWLAAESKFAAGMNAARLNFSHGAHRERVETIGHIHDIARELDQPVADSRREKASMCRRAPCKYRS